MTGTTDSSNDAPLSSHGGSHGSSQGPGRLVRQARETRGLSIEDLAAQIKLARGTLDAIERDDFAQLNEPVYVRGYYRKLSKVLPVTEAELLAAYERIAGHKAPPHPSKLILAGGPELGSGRTISPKLAIAIIIAGLLVGVLAFWGNNRNSLPETPTVKPTPVEPAVETPPVSSEPVTLEMPASTPVETAPAATAPAATDTPPPVAAVASTAAPAAAGTGLLQLQFNASSWTEIKDATGKVLLSGLVDGGSTQSLDGRPPLVVFLGNAPAVRVTYKGQPVDTTPFRRGDNTARITLP